MKPVDIRNDTWDSIQDRLNDDRLAVYVALCHTNGESITTRDLAAGMQRDVVDIRPRVTELLQLGFVQMTGRTRKEGLYRAVPTSLVKQRFEEQKKAGDQMLLSV